MKILKLHAQNSLDEEMIIAGLRVMENLEVFTCEFCCTDNILICVCESCKNLNHLDVSGSELVTDDGVRAVLQQRHLEYLDVFGTSVTESSYTDLIKGLDGSPAHLLRSLGCNIVTNSQLNVIVNKIPGLEKLKCGVEQCDMSIIKGCIKLRDLCLYFAKFSGIVELIHGIGKQLMVLELHNIKSVDVRFVVDNCPALKKLKIFSCSYSAKSHQNLRIFHPRFLELQYLTIDKSSKHPAYFNIDKLILFYILSQSFDVRVIHVESYADFDEEFFASVLRNNALNQLEEFSLHATSGKMFSLGCVRILLDRCPNISVVDISGGARPGESVQDFLLEAREKFPYIRISVEITV
jgi:hypothetical protein